MNWQILGAIETDSLCCEGQIGSVVEKALQLEARVHIHDPAMQMH